MAISVVWDLLMTVYDKMEIKYNIYVVSMYIVKIVYKI